MNDNNGIPTAEYAVDGEMKNGFPSGSIAVALNLQSGEFVSARMYIPMGGPTHVEQIAILLAALQTPRATTIYTDSLTSVEGYEKYVEKKVGGSSTLRCIKKMLLPSAKVIFVPREDNRLADTLARHCRKIHFTGYGRLSMEDKGRSFLILDKKEAPLDEVFDFQRVIANFRQCPPL